MLKSILTCLGFAALSVCLALSVWGMLFNWWLMMRRLKSRVEHVSAVFLMPLICLLLATHICDACCPSASWCKCVFLALAGAELVAETFHVLFKFVEGRPQASGESESA